MSEGKYFCLKSMTLFWKLCSSFIDVVYHIDEFVDIEKSLHPWDKAHLVMVYDLFNVLLDSDC